MTLVASAQRNDLDVTMYVESVITPMLRGTAKVDELLSDIWKTHHPEAIGTYRTEERQEKGIDCIGAIRKASRPKPASKVNERLAPAEARHTQPAAEQNHPSMRVRLRLR